MRHIYSIHTRDCLQFNQATDLHIFGMWKNTRTPRGNLCSHREKVKTPHNSTRGKDQNQVSGTLMQQFCQLCHCAAIYRIFSTRERSLRCKITILFKHACLTSVYNIKTGHLPNQSRPELSFLPTLIHQNKFQNMPVDFKCYS